MPEGGSSIFWVFTLLLQLNLAAPAALAAGCTGSYNEQNTRPTCKETCSKPPRILYGDPFNCQVGFQNELQDFSRKFQTDKAQLLTITNGSESSQFSPVVLSEISLYPLPLKGGKSVTPGLNITFDVSFLKPGLKAVSLTYGSPGNTKFTDEQYSSQQGRSVYRIFDFSSYAADTYDVEHPIPISYTCLYGLDDCDYVGKVYTVTLTSMAMNVPKMQEEYFKCGLKTCTISSLTYTISVTAVRYSNWNLRLPQQAQKPEWLIWNATIATALYPSPKDIYVVFEKRINYHLHTVKLTKHGTTVVEKRTKSQSCIFKDVPTGSYRIEVEFCDGFSECQTHRAFHEIIIVSPDHIENKTYIPTILASLSGTLVAVLLLLFLKWVRSRKSKGSPHNMERSIEQTKYVVFSNGDPASSLLSDSLVKHTLPKLGIEKNRILQSSYMKDTPNESIILILLPVDHKSFRGRIQNNNIYRQKIEELTKSRQRDILVIYFPYLKCLRCVHWPFLKKVKRICLIKQFHKLIKFLKIEKGTVTEKNLEKIRSDLEEKIQQTIQLLQNNDSHSRKSDELTQSYSDDDDENTDLCEIHRDPRFCPVHYPPTPVHHLPRGQMPKNHQGIFCHTETEPLLIHSNEFNSKDMSTIHHFESCPNYQIIPPSPEPYDRSVTKEIVWTISESSGYETAHIVPTSDNEEHLEDDQSLNEQILRMNRDHLHCESDIFKDDELDDKVYGINF